MDVLKMIIMITLAVMLIVSLSIYLLRKDIFVNSFKLHIGAQGINLNISAKEKNGPPYESDRSNPNS